MRGHSVRREVADRGSVVGVGPEVLWDGSSLYVEAGKAAKEARTRTEYWRPARIQGDSVRLKNMSAGSSSVLIWGARYCKRMSGEQAGTGD